jgi:hypothetical protein
MGGCGARRPVAFFPARFDAIHTVPPSLEILPPGDEVPVSFQSVILPRMVRKKTTGHHTVKHKAFDLQGFDFDFGESRCN